MVLYNKFTKIQIVTISILPFQKFLEFSKIESNMFNVVVAGGAGFIGSYLCKRLIAEGHHVYCIDNYITGSKYNIASLLDNPSFKLIEYDITKPFETIRDRLANVSYIFHLASPASPNQKSERRSSGEVEED